MLFFLHHGYRVIAHDRRGHGRSAQVSEGNDMDHYADDLAGLTQHLDLRDAVHVGHSVGGGEVARYLGRHGESRVAKVALSRRTRANGTLKTYAGFLHGMPTTHADTINNDLLTFIQS
jgi:pimeloyl-ACP methyl ester carboxylesterase